MSEANRKSRGGGDHKSEEARRIAAEGKEPAAINANRNNKIVAKKFNIGHSTAQETNEAYFERIKQQAAKILEDVQAVSEIDADEPEYARGFADGYLRADYSTSNEILVPVCSEAENPNTQYGRGWRDGVEAHGCF